MNTTQRIARRASRGSVALLVAAGLCACIDGGGSNTAETPTDPATPGLLTKGVALVTTSSGLAGGGPVVTAQLVATDATGRTSAATTDRQARYAIPFPKNAKYPVSLALSGGKDLITGAPPAFTLLATTTNSTPTLNVSPFTTLATRMAVARGGFTAANRAEALGYIFNQFSFGLDPAVVPDPFTTPADERTTAIMVKAGTTLAEMVARTTDTLAATGMSLTHDQVVNTLAGDLSDGLVDGSGPGADPHIAATANVVSAQVLYEAVRNRLVVRGTEATAAMDSAILQVTPQTTKTSDDVLISAQMLQQARVAVAAALAVAPSVELQTTAAALEPYTQATSAATLDAALPPYNPGAFSTAISEVSTGTPLQWETVNATVANGGPIDDTTPPPPEPPDPPPPLPITPGAMEFTAATFAIPENGGTFTTTVRRVDGSSGAATVQWRTRTLDGYGTADWASDYGTVDWATLNFADGETSKIISVRINEDTLVEGNETFSLLLANATGATLGAITTAVVTIGDNDTAPPADTTTLVYPPDSTLTLLPIASLSKPGYLAPITEPVFKTRLTRITDNAAFGTSYARHEYSKRSAWNSDGSLILINSNQQANRFLLDGHTYRIVDKVTVGLGELVWSNTNPNRMFAMNGLAFNSINATANTVTTLRTFTGYDRCYLGPWEGSVSADDGFAALACQRGSDLVVVVYNIAGNTIITTRTFAGQWGDSYFDWVSISPSGKYVAIKWFDSRGTVGYDRNTMAVVSSLGSGVAHGDLGFDAAGNDVYVAFDAYGGVKSFRIMDGRSIQLLPTSANLLAGHISCRNLRRPGWAYISPYDAFGKITTKDVYALKLDGSGTVQRFAQHHSTASDYNSQPQAVPNMDGTKVMFASNWGGTEANSYVAEMP